MYLSDERGKLFSGVSRVCEPCHPFWVGSASEKNRKESVRKHVCSTSRDHPSRRVEGVLVDLEERAESTTLENRKLNEGTDCTNSVNGGDRFCVTRPTIKPRFVLLGEASRKTCRSRETSTSDLNLFSSRARGTALVRSPSHT